MEEGVWGTPAARYMEFLGKALLHCAKDIEEETTAGMSPLHFCIFFDLPDHQLHAGSGVLTGVVAVHWQKKKK